MVFSGINRRFGSEQGTKVADVFETSKNHEMSKKIKKQKGLDRIKHARDPKRLPPEKRFLALEDDELLDEVSLEIEVMAIMDEKEKEEKKPA